MSYMYRYVSVYTAFIGKKKCDGFYKQSQHFKAWWECNWNLFDLTNFLVGSGYKHQRMQILLGGKAGKAVI